MNHTSKNKSRLLLELFVEWCCCGRASSESSSLEDTGKVEFITEFGGDSKKVSLYCRFSLYVVFSKVMWRMCSCVHLLVCLFVSWCVWRYKCKLFLVVCSCLHFLNFLVESVHVICLLNYLCRRRKLVLICHFIKWRNTDTDDHLAHHLSCHRRTTAIHTHGRYFNKYTCNNVKVCTAMCGYWS